jgi:hypothetical protein
MSTKPHIGVILTETARQQLAAEDIRLLLYNEKSFNCTAVHQDGVFLNMKVIDPTGLLPAPAEITIPIHFVLYMVSADVATKLGFK